MKQSTANLEDPKILADLVSDSFALLEMVMEPQDELVVRLVQG